MSKQIRITEFSELRQFLQESGNSDSAAEPKSRHDGKGKTVHVYLETQGRKGKTVTIVSGLQHNPQTMGEIAKTLKQYCGAGGTVKEGKIEIQGNQRTKISEKLQAMNYAVKI